MSYQALTETRERPEKNHTSKAVRVPSSALSRFGFENAAPYVAAIFAAGCQAAGTLCSTMANAGVAYSALKNAVSTGSVVNSDGTPLPTGTASRFMNRLPW